MQPPVLFCLTRYSPQPLGGSVGTPTGGTYSAINLSVLTAHSVGAPPG